MASIDPKTGKPVKRSTGLWGWNTIYGRDGEHGTPYMTRIWLGHLRLHIFHRGDYDPDHHDHPWNFWTFPFTSYVEEVAIPVGGAIDADGNMVPGSSKFSYFTQVVPAFRFSYRPATHCHRVLGAYSGEMIDDFGFTHRLSARLAALQSTDIKPLTDKRKIFTLVWRSGEERRWGFLKFRDGRWCWIHWKEYILGGGKDSPCQ